MIWRAARLVVVLLLFGVLALIQNTGPFLKACARYVTEG